MDSCLNGQGGTGNPCQTERTLALRGVLGRTQVVSAAWLQAWRLASWGVAEIAATLKVTMLGCSLPEREFLRNPE